MADVEHKNLTGASLHEPKGAAAATADKIYVADGAGSGTWEKITADSIDTNSIKNVNEVSLEFVIDDLSSAASHFLVLPWAGDITKIYSVTDTSIATTDTTLTSKIGGVAITGGVITIAFSGSAAGDVDSCTPSALNTVTEGQALEIVCGGETNTSGAHAHLTVVMDIS